MGKGGKFPWKCCAVSMFTQFFGCGNSVTRPSTVVFSSIQLSDDGRYAVLSITEGCEPVNQLWYCDLQRLPDGITGLYPAASIEALREQLFQRVNVCCVLRLRLNLQLLRAFEA